MKSKQEPVPDSLKKVALKHFPRSAPCRQRISGRQLSGSLTETDSCWEDMEISNFPLPKSRCKPFAH